MKTAQLRSGIAYGPLHSRRFGVSLGINILPEDCKLCTFSCVYCEHKDKPGKISKVPSYEDIFLGVGLEFQRVAQEKKHLDWVIISGNGEPTLHPDFPEIVKMVLMLRDRYLPGVYVGVLSNSSTCGDPKVRQALELLDGRFMKLDAGSMYKFHDLNRPSTMFAWGDVVEGLCELPHVAIQSMFVTGKVDNTDEQSVLDWIDAVECVHPDEVQIYTIDQTPQEAGILPVEETVLLDIAERLRKKTGIPAHVYTGGTEL